MNAAGRDAVRSAALDAIPMTTRKDLIAALPTALVTLGQMLRIDGQLRSTVEHGPSDGEA